MLPAVLPPTVQLTEHPVIVAVVSTTVDWVALGTSAVPVAEKVAPGVPVDVAVTVLGPAPVPRVHEVSCAKPLPFVPRLAGEAGDVLPPPDATVKVTVAPEIGFEARSVIRTWGAVATAAFTVALWASPAVLEMSDGLPCKAVAPNR